MCNGQEGRRVVTRWDRYKRSECLGFVLIKVLIQSPPAKIANSLSAIGLIPHSLGKKLTTSSWVMDVYVVFLGRVLSQNNHFPYQQLIESPNLGQISLSIWMWFRKFYQLCE